MSHKIGTVGFICFTLIVGCSKFRQAEPHVPSATIEKTPISKSKKMSVSYYGKELAGKKTASGEKFQPDGLTAAHRNLPFGTMLRISNPDNGKTVDVRVNDRGPFVGGRDLDVSHGAAVALGIKEEGVSTLLVETLPRAPS